MTIFITSDHHFDHKNIIKYCNRPFDSVEEMNEFMINRWNSRVGKQDIVIHLGDFGFGNRRAVKELRNRLNGMILLIRGNHDYRIKEEWGFFIREEPVQVGKYILSHKPLLKEEIPCGVINIHGHIHEKESEYGINVSVDKTGYEPVDLRELNAFF